MGKTLDQRPERPLTSREICKILSGVGGSLAAWCEPAEIVSAFEFFHEHKDAMLKMWQAMHSEIGEAMKNLQQSGQIPPGEPNG